jgi:predicted secreted protein
MNVEALVNLMYHSISYVGFLEMVSRFFLIDTMSDDNIVTTVQEFVKEQIYSKFQEMNMGTLLIYKDQETNEFVQKLVHTYELDQERWNEFVQTESQSMVVKIQEMLASRAKQTPVPLPRRPAENKLEENLKSSKPEEIEQQEMPRKKSGFGFKSMLNHLTKSRPKPKRGSKNVSIYSLGSRSVRTKQLSRQC